MNTTKKDRIVRLTILIGGALFILAMTYGSGMRAQVKKIQAKDQQRKLAEQNYRDAQRKMRVRLAVTSQLEARRQVARAIEELDRRNFGNVSDHVRTAVQLLQGVRSGNTTAPEMTKVLISLQQVNPQPDVNIGSERDNLRAIAVEMDRALDGFVPTFIRVSAEDDAAHPIQPPTMNDVPLPPGKQIKD
ncbi:MAG: hypothetical protein NW241_07890 [Bacteroidia bacterium]|nr:hypothetical protein [Bacteroidia bacterium]